MSEQTTKIIKREKPLGQWLLLAVVVFMVFLPSLESGFINWDDPNHLLNNPSVRSLCPESIKRIFTETVHSTYIPLTILSFNIEYHFFGFDPFVYHFNNLLLHIIVVGLVFLLTFKLSRNRRVAFMAALIFGIHPLHVEPVAWVTARKDMLYSIFYLWSLISYWTYLKDNNRGSYWLSVLLAFISILAKPMALSLPLILLVLDHIRERKLGFKILVDKIPFLICLVPVSAITYILNARIPGESLLETILIWVWSFSFYIVKFFVPFTLTPLYQAPEPIALTNPDYLLSFVIFIISIGIFVIFRRNKWIFFAFSYYFLSIFFLLRYDIGTDLSIVADRYMYLPSVGFCLLVAVFIDKILKTYQKKNAVKNVLAIVLVGMVGATLGFKTYVQCFIWKDSLTLWSYVLRRDPHQVAAYNNRGLAYTNLRQYNQALDDFYDGLLIDSNYTQIYINQGKVYKRLKNYTDALRSYNHALGIDQTSAEALLGKGTILRLMGQHEKALNSYDAAIKLDPTLEQVFNNRGVLYDLMKEYDLAITDFNHALRLNPYYKEAYNNRGIVYMSLKHYDKALSDFNWAINLDPHYAKGYNNRGRLYAHIGKVEEAILEFTIALNIDPNYREAAINQKMALDIKK